MSTSTDSRSRYAFFLGGRDLEMATIANLLAAIAPSPRLFDKRLPWGAKVSDYRADLEAAVADGFVAVLVELEIDLELPPTAVVVDHHGDRAGADRPTSLEQVFALLGLAPESWSRRLALVAANDRGHVAAMKRIGATVEEMLTIRSDDRAAQGVTVEEEAAAEAAVQNAERLSDGELTIVRLSHERTAPAADRMESALGGPGYRNLLVCTPGGATFYGLGPLVETLRSRFPDGWYGGDLPERGYWGSRVSCDQVVAALVEAIGEL